MVVYSGVLTAVTLGVIPLFLALTYIASQLLKRNFVEQLKRMRLPKVCLLKHLVAFRLLRLKMQRIQFAGVGSVISSFMSEF